MKQKLKTGILSFIITLLLAAALLHPSYSVQASDTNTSSITSVSGNTVAPCDDRDPSISED